MGALRDEWQGAGAGYGHLAELLGWQDQRLGRLQSVFRHVYVSGNSITISSPGFDHDGCDPAVMEQEMHT
jgi:hypothetical protein